MKFYATDGRFGYTLCDYHANKQGFRNGQETNSFVCEICETDREEAQDFRSELIEYIENEIKTLETQTNNFLNYEDIGYRNALTNILDFIQGAEVYLNYQTEKGN